MKPKTKPDDPAFPVLIKNNGSEIVHQGLTKREFFAAIIYCCNEIHPLDAVFTAEELIKALNGTPKEE